MAVSAAIFLRRGERHPYTNAGSAIAAGDVVPRVTGTSGCIGVAVNPIAASTGTGELDVQGVFTLTKQTGEAFTDGQVVYWDTTNGLTGTGTTTNTRAGRVVGAQASADVTANVNINVF